MPPRSPLPCLIDIIEAIDLIRAEITDTTLANFEADRRKRWLVERGPPSLRAQRSNLPGQTHRPRPNIPWPKVAGIGDTLRHEYQRIAHDVIWHVVQENLLPLDQACRAERARLDHP